MKSAVQARSQLAASAAEVIPFCCIVCFEEFNTTNRPPMVLPCGHTYVCQQCTKRLKRCMECRQSLFLPPSSNQEHNNNHLHPPHLAVGSSRTTRFNPNHPSTQQQQKTNNNPIPLPIPKNLVLLAMMEAAVRQGLQSNDPKEEREEIENKNTPASPTSIIDGDDGDSSSEEEEEEEEEEEVFDLDKIITGMATLVGPCGTYAVRDPQGLMVLPHDPRKKSIDESVLKESVSANAGSMATPHRSSKPMMANADNKQLSTPRAVFIEETKEDLPPPPPPAELELESPSSQQACTGGSSFVMQSTNSLAALDFEEGGGANAAVAAVAPEPFHVQFGQKLQVVSFREGVAQLARNRGYICASHSQLAKVGGPVDDSCRLEGLLDTIQGRGRDLQTTLEENHKIEVGLTEYIRSAQEQEPNHPVISQPPAPPAEVGQTLGRSKSADDDCLPQNRTPTTPPANVLLQPTLQTPESDRYSGNHLGHPDLSAETTGGGYIRASQTCPAMPSSPNSIDNSDLSVTARLSNGRDGGIQTSASSDNHNALALTFGCGVLPSELLGADGTGSSVSSGDTANALLRGFASALDGSPDQPSRNPAMSSWSHQSPPPASASSSFDSGYVNFRTGMSGHGGLSSSKRNHKNSPTPQYNRSTNHHQGHQPQTHRSNGRPRGRLWMMGEHRGISSSGGGSTSHQARTNRRTYYS
mmetsp:Transcript_17028/g.46670  ORF Transcript_17028/g.46670 Transcript_17028/m.46670 type:complete len:697 (+) Transcript_17028:428-2518(+)